MTSPVLAAKAVISTEKLQRLSETELLEVEGCTPYLGKLPRAVAPVRRSNLPTSQVSARGSLSKALFDAKPENWSQSLTDL